MITTWMNKTIDEKYGKYEINVVRPSDDKYSLHIVTCNRRFHNLALIQHNPANVLAFIQYKNKNHITIHQNPFISLIVANKYEHAMF